MVNLQVFKREIHTYIPKLDFYLKKKKKLNEKNKFKFEGKFKTLLVYFSLQNNIKVITNLTLKRKLPNPNNDTHKLENAL